MEKTTSFPLKFLPACFLMTFIISIAGFSYLAGGGEILSDISTKYISWIIIAGFSISGIAWSLAETKKLSQYSVYLGGSTLVLTISLILGFSREELRLPSIIGAVIVILLATIIQKKLQ